MKYLRAVVLFSAFIFCLFLESCSTVKPREESSPLFYPPLPEEPRIQFLTSFQSSRDIEGEGGGFMKFVLGKEETSKPIIKPYGVILRHHKILIADTVANTIEILDLDQKTFKYFTPKGNVVQLTSPVNVEMSEDGRIFIAETGLGQVFVFDADGQFLNTIGAKNELKPTDLVIRDNRLYVCDLKSHAVRVYDVSNYSFIYSVPKENAGNDAKLFSPTNIDVDSSGHIYVSDTGSFNVKKYAPDGTWVKSFGVHGDALGQFARNKGVAVDREGRIYVVDAAIENVQIFDAEGNLLLGFPNPGGPASLVLPAGIFIDYDHLDYFRSFISDDFNAEYLILVTSQYGDRKLSVFAFGRKK